MKDSDKIIELESKNVFPEHFNIDANRFILMAIYYLKSKNMKPTPMAIMEVLSSGEAKESVAKLGGLDYLMLLSETNIPSDNIGIFIEKVMQSHTRRMMYNIAKQTMDFMLSKDAEILNPSELISFTEQRIVDLGVNTQGSEEVYKMGDETEDVLAQRAENPNTVPGLETGWEQFDGYTGGFQNGDLTILVAPSKTGKSVTLTNWAKKISISDQIPALYIDTEMKSREQEDRLLSNITGIPHTEIITGQYVMDTVNGKAVDKIAKLKEAREQLQMGNYYHIYMPQFTIEKVTALARKFQMQFGIKILFFDYIKIPSNQADFRSAQEYQKLGFFTSGLKDLAGMLDIPVVSACQANRSNTDNENPSEADIGGSYRILQLASKLMFLYNKSAERIAKDGGAQAGNQMLFIKFQRNGESDCPPINIMFDKPIIRQYEV